MGSYSWNKPPVAQRIVKVKANSSSAIVGIIRKKGSISLVNALSAKFIKLIKYLILADIRDGPAIFFKRKMGGEENGRK